MCKSGVGYSETYGGRGTWRELDARNPGVGVPERFARTLGNDDGATQLLDDDCVVDAFALISGRG